MANPQAEEGHMDLALEIVDAFQRLQLSGNQWRILWVILRQTYGWHKKEDRISISYFERKTGLERRHIHRALKDMETRLIIAKNVTQKIASYRFQKDYTKWSLLPKMPNDILTTDKIGNDIVAKNVPPSLPILAPTKETIQKKLVQKKLKGGNGFVLPEWISRETWDSYLEMRDKNKRKATPKAQELIVKKLEGLKAQGHDPDLVLLQSIENSWQGVFPLKDRNGQQGGWQV